MAITPAYESIEMLTYLSSCSIGCGNAMEGPVVHSTAAAPIYRFTSESIMQERQMSGVREPSDGRTDVSYDILQLLF